MNYDDIDRQVDAFTSGNDPNPGGRFPSGSYLTPDEARERGVGWVSRPGEPQDLNHPYHYQTPDQARANGVNWATQSSIQRGRSPHPAMTALYRDASRQNRLSDLIGYGYDDYAGSLAPVSSHMPVDRRTLASLIQPQAAPLEFFSRK